MVDIQIAAERDRGGIDQRAIPVSAGLLPVLVAGQRYVDGVRLPAREGQKPVKISVDISPGKFRQLRWFEPLGAVQVRRLLSRETVVASNRRRVRFCRKTWG